MFVPDQLEGVRGKFEGFYRQCYDPYDILVLIESLIRPIVVPLVSMTKNILEIPELSLKQLLADIMMLLLICCCVVLLEYTSLSNACYIYLLLSNGDHSVKHFI